MSGGHGGARSGAGRKRNSEKYAEQIAALHDRIASRLPDRTAALELLADGGYEQIQEFYEPAGLIQINKLVETKEGTIRVTELAFPHLDPKEMVCVRRVRSLAAPDRQANIYLIDRLAGKPVQATELSGPNGGAIPLSIEETITKIYGDEDGD